MSCRLRSVATAALAPVMFLLAASASSQSVDEAFGHFSDLDVSGYRITDPGAGYFDVVARRTFLAQSRDPAIRTWRDRHAMGVSCRAAMALPVLDYEIALPGFYVNNEAWREYIKVFSEFEDTMSALAAAETVVKDGYHADCLVDVLLRWARAGALEKFRYTVSDRQAWYTTESTMFSASLALMAVRDRVAKTRRADLAEIDSWLVGLARHHSSINGLPGSSCCNNHLYRRAVYAMSIGIMTDDEGLFGFGVRAFHTALWLAGEDGELPFEMGRGRRAVHYQNFAVMYLIMLAEMMERQGIDAYAIRVDGNGLQDLIDIALDMMLDPSVVRQFGVEDEQLLTYDSDSQYLAWLEPYFARTRDPRAAQLMAGRRPLYNRSLGGYMSLFFFEPDEDLSRMAPDQSG